jgi:NADH-quinone oxidoreductase subunit L
MTCTAGTPTAARRRFIVNRIGDFGMILVAMIMVWSTRRHADLHRLGDAPHLLTPTTVNFYHLPAAATRRRRQERPISALRLAARRHGRPDAGLGAHPCRHDGDGRRLHDHPHQPFVARRRAGRSKCRLGRHPHRAVSGHDRLVQYDLKKILAYSTVSQLGYMVAAAGVGALRARRSSILVTHAFFKALLFLAAGSVMHATGRHDLDIGGWAVTRR